MIQEIKDIWMTFSLLERCLWSVMIVVCLAIIESMWITGVV